ncbi:cytochrome c maturation protein CcmE [Bryobacter aggregatus]|uniref:cytochrome c maturation protein CcmE n=1 Tax=Bryobacter aggregatus TaxID=360054 RepID=UPI000560169B|nr:cytochrome c maturation protein CcmE [Bryobacter aggregatus]
MKPYMKFGLIITVVIATIGWLAIDGATGNTAYYKNVSEVHQMGPKALGKRFKVGGDVVKGSIQRNGAEVSFQIVELNNANNAMPLRITYTGTEPLPDTFRDGAQALADGRMNPDGTFTANHIQAKCASKYEAKPGQIKPGTDPSHAPKTTVSRS